MRRGLWGELSRATWTRRGLEHRILLVARAKRGAECGRQGLFVRDVSKFDRNTHTRMATPESGRQGTAQAVGPTPGIWLSDRMERRVRRASGAGLVFATEPQAELRMSGGLAPRPGLLGAVD
jgi:transposase InsO family protein